MGDQLVEEERRLNQSDDDEELIDFPSRQERQPLSSRLVSAALVFLPLIAIVTLVIVSLVLKKTPSDPLITDDLVVFGLLVLILHIVFYTSSLQYKPVQLFYKIIPSLLLLYFVPGILNTAGVISGEKSTLYNTSKRYLLAPCLILLTISIDLKSVAKLGPKAVLMFLAGTTGVVVGGPLAVTIVGAVSPSTVGGQGPEAVWRGLACIAGSWIGGSANQAAMLEIFGAGREIFSLCVAVDVIIANIWMGVLLFLAPRAKQVDRLLRADSSAIDKLKRKIDLLHQTSHRVPTTQDLLEIITVCFVATGASQWIATSVSSYLKANAAYLSKFSLTDDFFWLLVLSTTVGLILSFTRARRLENAGASKIGAVMLYLLITTIGMQMDITYIVKNPGLLVVGLIWIIVHAICLIGAAFALKAPLFFLAVGSQANIGGAASASVVASAFAPALASVGVLLSIFGYILGTYLGFVTGVLLELASPSTS